MFTTPIAQSEWIITSKLCCSGHLAKSGARADLSFCGPGLRDSGLVFGGGQGDGDILASEDDDDCDVQGHRDVDGDEALFDGDGGCDGAYQGADLGNAHGGSRGVQGNVDIDGDTSVSDGGGDDQEVGMDGAGGGDDNGDGVRHGDNYGGDALCGGDGDDYGCGGDFGDNKGGDGGNGDDGDKGVYGNSDSGNHKGGDGGNGNNGDNGRGHGGREAGGDCGDSISGGGHRGDDLDAGDDDDGDPNSGGCGLGGRAAE